MMKNLVFQVSIPKYDKEEYITKGFVKERILPILKVCMISLIRERRNTQKEVVQIIFV